MLVVEDDPRFRRSVAQLLQHEGYRVVGASDGLDALEALEQISPWLILLDIRLPMMGGGELARELKHRGSRSRIVVMTAAADARRWATDIQADGYLGKPFETDELLDAVARLRPST